MPNPAVHVGTRGLKPEGQIMFATHNTHIINDVVIGPDGNLARESIHATMDGRTRGGFDMRYKAFSHDLEDIWEYRQFAKELFEFLSSKEDQDD